MTTDIDRTIEKLKLVVEINWEEVLEKNIAKLKARYPEGFDTEKANNRAEGDI